MGLEKAIEYKKEHRKPYRGSKAFDCSCRNHGTCSWCLENRTIKNTKREQSAADAIEDFFNETAGKGISTTSEENKS